MRRTMHENRRDFDAAKRLRETFTDRPMSKVKDTRWSWPKHMNAVGVCTAVMYKSDKWKKIGAFEDYKHINESSEDSHPLLIGGGFSLGLSDIGVTTHPEKTLLNTRMPDAFAELATILGIQYKLYDSDGGIGDEYYECKIVHAHLGAARCDNGETLLLVYTPSTLCCVIAGFAVEKDGIVK
jgi:hypothetical protein